MCSITTEEAYTMVQEFAKEYYDTLVSKPNANGLEHFYDEKSKYVFLQHGKPDYTVEGLYKIGRFLERMKYHKCTLKIESVDTIEVRPNWYTVLTVCKLSQPEELQKPRKFVQSTVVKFLSSSVKKFLIIGTVFKFDDTITTDDVSETETDCSAALENKHLNNSDNSNTEHIDRDTIIIKPGAVKIMQKSIAKISTIADATDAIIGLTKLSIKNVINNPNDLVSSSSSSSSVHEPNNKKTTKQPQTVIIKNNKNACSAEKQKESINNDVPVVGQLYVGGLSRKVGINDLSTCFSRFGTLTKVNIYKKKNRHDQHNYAIIQFKKPELINKIAQLGTILLENGDKVIVEKSNK